MSLLISHRVPGILFSCCGSFFEDFTQPSKVDTKSSELYEGWAGLWVGTLKALD